MGNNSLIRAGMSDSEIGEVVDAAASGFIFADYRSRRSINTLKSQARDLEEFARFLKEALKMERANMDEDASQWNGITWGMVKAFTLRMLTQEYSISTINRRLATVRTYAGLASLAGVISPDDLAKIKGVKHYAGREARNVDQKRREGGRKTRVFKGEKPVKKETATDIPLHMITSLKSRPSTPQGLRDKVIVCLLFDHGLRRCDLASLKRGDFDLVKGRFRFFQEKVNKWNRHIITQDLMAALGEYLEHVHREPEDYLLVSFFRGGAVRGALTYEGIRSIVDNLGKEIGLDWSSHDARHSYATRAIDAGSPLTAVAAAGGWSTLSMLQRYVNEGETTNDDVKL